MTNKQIAILSVRKEWGLTPDMNISDKLITKSWRYTQVLFQLEWEPLKNALLNEISKLCKSILNWIEMRKDD
jgi:hypothetical protein